MADHYFRGLEGECLDCGLRPAAHPHPPALDGQTICVSREVLIEFVRSIAEYDRYLAFAEPPAAYDGEVELYGLRFDHQVMTDIERSAREIYDLLKKDHEL
jgi:hypothetical protein